MLKRDLYYERIPTKSLRNDVRFLGNILGRVIKKQEGESFFNLVERIRLLSKANIKNKLRVVPLFETLQDLKNAKSIMEKLFSLSWYRKLIKNKQEIMIGYSDSSKDAGKLSASWHQYKLQEEVLIIAKKYKIELTFFHGRGGSHGRGGGPIQATMRSQPPNSV